MRGSDGPATSRLTSRARILVNRGSGAHDAAALHREIEAAFGRHGWGVDFVVCQRGDLAERVDEAARRPGGTIVVAGGDGTINAVASACRRVQRPFGIVPAGTYNYIARNLGIPLDVDAAVAAIVGGRARDVDAGEINGRLFLNNAGTGLYSHLIERREHDKQRFGRHRIVGVASGLRALLDPRPLVGVELRADGEAPRTLRTTTLFFGVNALQLENYHVAARDCLGVGQLAVLSLALRSRADIARAAWGALAGTLDAAANVESLCAHEVQVTTPRAQLPVAVDGEIVRLRSPLEVRLCRAALQVLVPAAEPAR